MIRGSTVRRLASWGGLLLLAAVLFGLFAMHGLQPSPGPVAAPSVLTLQAGHAGSPDTAMPLDMRHDSGPSTPYDGHGGGQVCLAFLLAGAVLLLLLVMMAANRCVPAPIRFVIPALPRGPTARPRGPSLAQLCVIRV